LFFPAGVYRITETIVIPPYALLWGDGAAGSVIQMNSGDDSAARAYVARTGDSLQQTGANISNNGAIAPQYITVMNLGFQTTDPDVDVFLVEDAVNCSFQGVSFTGPLIETDLNTDGDDIAGVRFISTASLVCEQIVFDRCVFSGTTYGINTDDQVKGVNITNSNFNTLYQGILLGTDTPINGGPTGVRIMGNVFDNIFAQGVVIGNVNLNATGHNIFYLVANGVTVAGQGSFGSLSSPQFAIVEIRGDNNVSISDMFQRADAFATTDPRIELNNKQVIATTNGKQIAMGTFTRETGLSTTLVNNSSNTVFTTTATAFSADYTIVRDTSRRTGTLTITNIDGVGLSYNDNFVQNTDTGVTLSVTQSAGTVTVAYTCALIPFGTNGSMNYSIYRTN
jgi:hypothetical protein